MNRYFHVDNNIAYFGCLICDQYPLYSNEYND